MSKTKTDWEVNTMKMDRCITKAELYETLGAVILVIFIYLASWLLAKIEYKVAKPEIDYVTKISTGTVEDSCGYAIDSMIKKAKESNIVNGMLELHLRDYCSEFKAIAKEIHDTHGCNPHLILDIEKAPKSNHLTAIIKTCYVDTHYIARKLEENGIKVIAIDDCIEKFYGVDR